MIWDALRIIWNDIKTGDDFRGKWYLWASQQMAHTLLGVILVSVSCLVYMSFTGELPYKLHLFLFLSVGYLLWEFALQVQGPKHTIDSLEDYLFVVGYGAGSVITVFTEIESGRPEVSMDLVAAIPFILISTLHLLYGCISRILNGR